MLHSHRNARIVVLGDAMLDRYLIGEVERISPEAPVPVVRFQRDAATVGGAGNVACNIAALGGLATLVTAIGADGDGDELAALLAAGGVEVEAVRTEGRETVAKTRVMSGAHHLLRIDREASGPISAADEEALVSRLGRLLPRASALVISDYAKGVLTDRILSTAITLARAKGMPIVVDPKRRDLSAYAGASVIKPNRSELAAATGLPCRSDADIERAAEAVTRLTGAAMLITRSEQGMSFHVAGEPPIHMPTRARLVFDVSGAGDTVAAVVACGLVDGIGMREIMRLANLAAGIVVSKPGAATVTLDELRAAAAAEDAPHAFRKGGLTGRATARAIREHWRRQGLSVGFTNGCFDLLHPGHIAILRGAARHCDRLIVGLNADASVARLKGPTRPVQREAARAEVLGAIDCVDLVVLFEEDTPLELIRSLAPDVLVKGADYLEHEIVGAELVRAAGGRVERVPLVAGQSTSELIRRSTLREAPALTSGAA